MKEDENMENTKRKQLGSIPYSVLDLSPVMKGFSAADSFRNTVDLAQHVKNGV